MGCAAYSNSRLDPRSRTTRRAGLPRRTTNLVPSGDQSPGTQSSQRGEGGEVPMVGTRTVPGFSAIPLPIASTDPSGLTRTPRELEYVI